MVLLDGGPIAERALPEAIQIAKQHGAHVVIIGESKRHNVDAIILAQEETSWFGRLVGADAASWLQSKTNADVMVVSPSAIHRRGYYIAR